MLKIPENMTFESLSSLRSGNASWKLLASPQAAFAASFLYEVFILAGRRAIGEPEFLELLDDFIMMKRQGGALDGYNQSAKYYLSVWSDNEHGWLRKFYLHDEPHVDLTAAAQKAIEWLDSLKQQKFIGTESRLRTVFDLLHQIAEGTDTNPQRRLKLLEEERAAISAKIAALKNNEPVEILDKIQIKERYMQAADIAKNILADFREVEDNFRRLEMEMRDKVVTWTQGRGDLLAEVFARRDGIINSEQGQSFDAFWRFLMMSDKQSDFRDAVDRVQALDSVADDSDIDLHRIHRDWINAASAVQATVAGLSRQLRRYVDYSFLQEERRIYELIQQIEKQAVTIRERQPVGVFMQIDAIKPEVVLPMDRPLFVPPISRSLQAVKIERGQADLNVNALFKQVYVDKKILKQQVDVLLEKKSSVSLAEVVQKFPVTKGLTELLGYIELADDGRIDSDVSPELIEIVMQNPQGRRMAALLEEIVFTKFDRR